MPKGELLDQHGMRTGLKLMSSLRALHSVGARNCSLQGKECPPYALTRKTLEKVFFHLSLEKKVSGAEEIVKHKRFIQRNLLTEM